MWRGRGLHTLPPPPVNPSNMHNGYVHVQANNLNSLWNYIFYAPLKLASSDKDHASLHQNLIASSISHMFRITTPPFTNAQPLFCFILFLKHSSRFFLSFFPELPLPLKLGLF